MAMAATSGVTWPSDGDRHGERVVGDGEQQVLPDQPPRLARDVDRVRHRLEVVAQEDDVGGVAPDVGGRRRRHRDMGGGQRRRVVEAVADHQHACRPAAASAAMRATFAAGDMPATARARRATRPARAPAPRCRRTRSRRACPSPSTRRRPRARRPAARPRRRTGTAAARPRCSTTPGPTVLSCGQRPIRAAETIDLVAEPRLEAEPRMLADAGQRNRRPCRRGPAAASACE